ncbi:hypothetical protein GS425_11760, partial [Rhodococcus hoagii]|nr:hypothetical protein [Prescottella equi]
SSASRPARPKDPKQTLRKAINTLPFRIGLFYVGSLIVILSVASCRTSTP